MPSSKPVASGGEKTAESEQDAPIGPGESEAPAKPIPPPDVGLQAYLQILGGFFLMFNIWGMVLTYGTFQSYASILPSSNLVPDI